MQALSAARPTRLVSSVAATLAAVLLFSLAGTVARADVQNPAQQRCLVTATKSGAKIAKAQAKEIRGCIRDVARNGFSSLYEGLACLTADVRARVAMARAKASSTLTVACAAPPDFGFSSIADVADSAVEEDVSLARDVFGSSLSLAILRTSTNPAGATCQNVAQNDYERVVAAKIKSYAKCEKNGLKNAGITSEANLLTCLTAVKSPSQKKVGAALARLRSDVADRCGVVTLHDAFPGRCTNELTPSALTDCLAEVIDCRACTMISLMHGIDADCDTFDDGAANGSCLASDATTTTLPPWAGACTNDEDEAVLASVDIQQKTRACTLQCLFSTTRPQCIASCIVNGTGLGAACAFCYADSSECGIHNCAGQCSQSQTAPGCVSCLEAAGCIDAFDECAGTSPTTTTPPGSSTTTTMIVGPTTTTTTTLPPVGACSNPADEAVDASHDLQAEATTCTISCLGSGAPNLSQCVAQCVSANTGLSSDCATCYGQTSQCGLTNCAAECAVNQSSPACVACLATHCVPAFDQCSEGTPTTTGSMPTTTVTVTTTTISDGTTTTVPPMPGACTNSADQAVLDSVNIQAQVTSCTLGCLSASDIAQCTADCVVAATGLSPECALCYGDSSECGINNCAGQCAVNQNSPACVSCLNAHCIPAFNTCAGTTSATTTTTGNNTTTTVDETTTTTTLPSGSGACINAPDQTVSNNFNLQAETTSCTIGCLSASNRPVCVSTCLQNGTGLSSGCAGCYAQSSECGLQHCASQCAVNQSSAPCLACLEANCVPAFNACSGEGEPPPPASCTNGMQDGTETDVDCGGACNECAIGKHCTDGDDCISGNCIATVCAAPSTLIALGSCVQGYIDPFADPDAVDLGGLPATGSDDGYKLVLASPSDVAIELTNQLGATATLDAALVTVPDNGASAVSGLSTGAVVAGQNGTAGPVTVNAGTYYLYVDSQIAGTYGPYQVCVVPPPTIAINTCVTGTVGNGDGNDVQIAGTTGAGGDKGLRFTAPTGTSNVIMTLRNVSGASKMAAAIYSGTTKLPGSETPDAALFTERTVGPFPVSANIAYTVQVDTADVDSFGTFEVCVYAAGCGDGLVTGGEQCDDTNTTSGDGCSSTCTLESGKIVVNSCRTDNIPLFPINADCDDWTMPVAQNESVYVELTNPAGGTLLGIGSLRLGSTQLASTGNVPIGQTGSTAVTSVTAPNNYTVRVCDVTGAGTGNYTVCVRRARRIELGTCFASNVTDGDGNVINLAGPISGGDEDVIFQSPTSTNVKLTLSVDSAGGLLAAGIYNGQPGSLLAGSAVGASPSPLAVGQSGTSGIVAVNVGQTYRVYTDIASLGTAGTNYTICLAEAAGDQCLNPEDEDVRAAYNLSAEAEDAGLSCTGSSSCISQTLQNDTGLSPECAGCYGDVGGCAASNCAFQCLGDSGSSGCRNCVASNCAQEFEVCSGWTYGQ